MQEERGSWAAGQPWHDCNRDARQRLGSGGRGLKASSVENHIDDANNSTSEIC